MPRGQQVLLINRGGGGALGGGGKEAGNSGAVVVRPDSVAPVQAQNMLLPSLRMGRGKSTVDDCLQKVREAERSLQRSLHLAREALTTLSEQQQVAAPAPPETEKTEDGAPSLGTAQDRNRAQQLFNSVDKDGSGKISVNELRRLMDASREEPLTDSEFEDLKMKMCSSDKDADGQLNFEEFYKAFCHVNQNNSGERKTEVDELQKEALQAHQQEKMTPEQHVQIHGVQTSAVTRYLRKELDETNACLQLPWAALIFFFFFAAVRTHFDLDRLHAVDQAITWDIKENANFAFSGIAPYENGRMGHKNIEDVNSIADFWSFLNMGIVPIFWPQGWDVNEVRLNTIAKCQGMREALLSWGGHGDTSLNGTGPEWDNMDACPERPDEVRFPEDTKEFFGGGKVKMDGTYLLFHRIIGGVRMRQERVDLVRCPDRVQEIKGTTPQGMCTSHPDYWLKPELQRSLRIDLNLVNRPGGHSQFLLSNMSQDAIRDKLRTLENEAWFSPQTRKIELLFTTYNMNEDLLTATYIIFFLNRGGHIFKNVEPVSFSLDPYHGLWYSYVFDAAWALLCLKLLVEETIEIAKHWKQLGLAKGTRVYMTLANAIDWVSIAFTIALCIFWFYHLLGLQEIQDVLTTGDVQLQGTWADDAERERFFSMVDGAVTETHDMRILLAAYPFVIVSRFFKAFSSQPRLAMVTKTFAKASVDIFHFGVVFFTVFIIFAFSAMILWGQELEEFANEGRSFHSAFRILLGDFEWEPLTTVGRMWAYIWFWTFVWLVNLIMLNMLLAIIMDVYTDVKSGSADAETLWSQSVEIFIRTRDVFSGRTVPLRRVLLALDPTDLDETDENEDPEEDIVLFPNTLAEKVSKMSEEQGFHVLLEAKKLQLRDSRDSDTMSEALIRIQDIDDRTSRIQEILVRMVTVQQFSFGDNGGNYLRGGSVVL